MDLTSTATTIFTTNGISPQIGILLLIALCSILMSMQDWRIGIISFVLGSTIFEIISYIMAWDTVLSAGILFCSIILMAFSLFVTKQGGQLI